MSEHEELKSRFQNYNNSDRSKTIASRNRALSTARSANWQLVCLKAIARMTRSVSLSLFFSLNPPECLLIFPCFERYSFRDLFSMYFLILQSCWRTNASNSRNSSDRHSNFINPYDFAFFFVAAVIHTVVIYLSDFTLKFSRIICEHTVLKTCTIYYSPRS